MPRILVFSFFCLLLAACCKDDEGAGVECPCLVVDQHPIYKACLPIIDYNSARDCSPHEILQEVYSNIVYPPQARQDSIQGRIVISFDIFTDGSLGNYETVFDTSGYGLAEAAIAGIRSLETLGFCPARENCEPIVYKFTLPISFKLF